MENTICPPIVGYIVTHNLTVSGATMTTIVTSPVAIIPLNGVPSGHYYAAVAALNVVGQGESIQESITCMYMPLKIVNNYTVTFSCSGSTSVLYSSNISEYVFNCTFQ